uniref:Uncharacterized protein n=1 Tax=Anguilla anguilla TaxID=7936 RepID=A0A0E9PEJ6_ANGAN
MSYLSILTSKNITGLFFISFSTCIKTLQVNRK